MSLLPHLRVRVEFSGKTQILYKKIQDEKASLAFLHQENRFLKQLRYFGGTIQREAQKELNKNKGKITAAIEVVQELQSLFAQEYEKDYDKSYQKAVENSNNQKTKLSTAHNTSSFSSAVEQVKPKHPDVVKLDRILRQANSVSYMFTHEIRSAIVKRIEELS